MISTRGAAAAAAAAEAELYGFIVAAATVPPTTDAVAPAPAAEEWLTAAGAEVFGAEFIAVGAPPPAPPVAFIFELCWFCCGMYEPRGMNTEELVICEWA